ncbi:uncharacterized protein K489DRAFT_381733 [Dissoconium aciculare CBS 342.82]|uniref:Uncharacterized protein n=1 Tax=Dissoconium aciculare CBS 342.82 TaxID=1314786 RepID=A0A6J3M4A3_9PEZI|nr:uncharacterized protein K489DRAFT_381733 [Dissoconium aciculare CBS 342.82]KAF1821742.1 hypothetical protein K489DRAFT_381733 [Dissoconium aciculare CBS 342.82]
MSLASLEVMLLTLPLELQGGRHKRSETPRVRYDRLQFNVLRSRIHSAHFASVPGFQDDMEKAICLRNRHYILQSRLKTLRRVLDATIEAPGGTVLAIANARAYLLSEIQSYPTCKSRKNGARYPTDLSRMVRIP